ncbi:MAG: DUF5130 family protein [Marmoricola sp.]
MRVRAGDLTAAQRREIDAAIRAAETASRFEFSVYVGPTEPDHRDYAERMHAVMASPDRSVLVMIDPEDRALEVVTGQVVRRVLSDQQVQLAAMTMRSSFVEGDLVGGILAGVAMLGQAARRPHTLHAAP